MTKPVKQSAPLKIGGAGAILFLQADGVYRASFPVPNNDLLLDPTHFSKWARWVSSRLAKEITDFPAAVRRVRRALVNPTSVQAQLSSTHLDYRARLYYITAPFAREGFSACTSLVATGINCIKYEELAQRFDDRLSVHIIPNNYRI